MGETQTTVGYVSLKQSLYRDYSRSYDEDRRRFVGAGALAERVRWALEPFCAGQRLLDLGCGSGDVLLEAAQQGRGAATLVGVDLTPEMLGLAQARLGREAAMSFAPCLDLTTPSPAGPGSCPG